MQINNMLIRVHTIINPYFSLFN